MTMHVLAGSPVPLHSSTDLTAVRAAYYARTPEVDDRTQRVVCGNDGHRGSALRGAFNEAHVLAVTQAICDYRHQHGIGGPLFIGRDEHALSEAAFATAVETLTINRVSVMLEGDGGCTPAPAVSRAILTHNRCPPRGVADGIVVASCHARPAYGSFSYKPPTGGPAETAVARWIEARANRLLSADSGALSRLTYARARRPNTTQEYDYVGSYVRDLGSVIDMDAIRFSGLRIGVDPRGGAAAGMWAEIAEAYGLDIDIVNDAMDPTSRFMPVEWDGQASMDCARIDASTTRLELRDRFDIAFANDTGADRYGIMTHAAGVINPNDYLAAAISYLFTHRPAWGRDVSVGKTAMSSGLIDRVASNLGRRVVEVPSAFKWFVPGLSAGSLGFGGEECAAATFLQRDGAAWTTDKDGIVMDLLAAELMAATGRDPSELYADLARELGTPVSERIDAPATPAQQALLASLSASDVPTSKVAGDRVADVWTVAPGNGAPLGGIKVTTANGWFAARPCGTETGYTLFAESFKGRDHLQRIQSEALSILSRILAPVAR